MGDGPGEGRGGKKKKNVYGDDWLTLRGKNCDRMEAGGSGRRSVVRRARGVSRCNGREVGGSGQ